MGYFGDREYMQGGQFKKKTDENGRVVIVTGSNTGIGKETVLELARRGATVYMACRDEARAEKARQEITKETNNENIFYRELDLSSLESIRKFVEKLVICLGNIEQLEYFILLITFL